MNRRGFLKGLMGAGVSAFAAPAIVRASSLMAIKPWVEDFGAGFQFSGFYSSIPAGLFAIRQDVAGGTTLEYVAVNPDYWGEIAKDFAIGGTRMQSLKVLGIDVLPFRPA